MKTTSLISIITTAYNIEKLLSMCLDSILSQTLDDFELIIVDDGSTDSSGVICDEYAKKDPRIRVIHQENKGVSDSWNEAMKNVNGEYIGFVDGDDMIHSRMYELLYRAIQKTHSDVAYCDYQRVYGEGRFDFSSNDFKDLENKIRISSLEDEMSNNVNFPMVWRGLYKTELIKNERFLSRRNGQDYFWSTRVLLKANQVARVDEKLYGWRKRTGSESYVAFRKRTIDYVVVKRHTVEYIKEHAPEWIVPYTVGMFTFCLDAVNRLPELSDHSVKQNYKSELKKALSYFSEISISDIIKDLYTEKRRKYIAVAGKVSFPLACFLKKNLVKVINR